MVGAFFLPKVMSAFLRPSKELTYKMTHRIIECVGVGFIWFYREMNELINPHHNPLSVELQLEIFEALKQHC